MQIYVMIIESMISAIKSLSTSKLRSFLTILGIVIGITSVTVISSIGGGLQNSIMESLEGLGLERIEIYANTEVGTPGLTLEDAELLKEHEDVALTIPTINFYSIVKERITDESMYVSFNATSPEFKSLLTKKITSGRFLMEQDIINAANSVVIPERLSERYFGYKDSVGEIIEINITGDELVELVVVGIVESSPNDAMFNTTMEIYTPYTFIQEYADMDSLNSISIVVKDGVDVATMPDELKRMLQIKNKATDKGYTVYNLMQEMDTIRQTFGQVVLFVNVVASIALFVGSIGIMNIMLVTVTERTREIGIRKSLGATKSNIKLQFLIEALILSLLGGFVGITLGYTLAIVLGLSLEITPAFSINSIFGSLFVSGLIGILSGVYPASKASNLNPIDALRYE